jgi:UDP-N-acetylglucosamine/UDP-N-acetylgalactosamine diphosphorylase
VPTVEPVPESSVSTVDDRTPEDKERWWRRGLRAISEGKLAAVLLAGGQVLLNNSFRVLCVCPNHTVALWKMLIYVAPFFSNCVQGTRLGSSDPKGCFSKLFYPTPLILLLLCATSSMYFFDRSQQGKPLPILYIFFYSRPV